MDIVKLVADLSSPLDGLIRMECLRNGTSLPQEEFDVLNNNRNPTGSGTISPDKIEKSLFLDSNNIRYIENSISDNTQVITSINEEGPNKAECRKLALETHTREEFQQFHELEEDLAKVLDEKLELDNKLKLANRELEELKAKIFRFEQTEANLWTEFMSAKPSSQLIDEQLCGINSSNEASESQLKIILVEWSRLQYRVKVLEREIQDKQEKNALLEANCQRFVDQLLR
jgi:chromosome segregation ATPase